VVRGHNAGDSDFDVYGSPLLRSLNNLAFVLLHRDPPLPNELLETAAEARAVADRLAARDPAATPDVALTLLHFAEAHVRIGLELDLAKSAVDTLLSAYRKQASATGLTRSHHRPAPMADGPLRLA
jgi:hypothetical protein